MHQNLERVKANAEKSTTEDLLERVTVFRDQMEPEAVEIIERELFKRGYGSERIAAYGQAQVIRRPDGSTAACSFCSRAAIAQGWGWHLWRGRFPLFPRWLRWCAEHQSKIQAGHRAP